MNKVESLRILNDVRNKAEDLSDEDKKKNI